MERETFKIINIYTQSSYYTNHKPSDLLPGDIAFWEGIKKEAMNSNFTKFRQVYLDNARNVNESEVLEKTPTEYSNLYGEIADDAVKKYISQGNLNVTSDEWCTVTPPTSPQNVLAGPPLMPNKYETISVNLDGNDVFESGYDILVANLSKIIYNMGKAIAPQFIELCSAHPHLAFVALSPFLFSILGAKIHQVIDLLLVDSNFGTLLRYIKTIVFRQT